MCTPPFNCCVAAFFTWSLRLLLHRAQSCFPSSPAFPTTVSNQFQRTFASSMGNVLRFLNCCKPRTKDDEIGESYPPQSVSSLAHHLFNFENTSLVLISLCPDLHISSFWLIWIVGLSSIYVNIIQRCVIFYLCDGFRSRKSLVTMLCLPGERRLTGNWSKLRTLVSFINKLIFGIVMKV